jgi:hypothetical protein
LLHITNGDVAGNRLAKLFPGEVVPWRDVLHEGAVRPLPLDELSEERARFIAGCGWGPYAGVREGFRRRDERLKSAKDHEEVVLWFEHDLYDQLQLVQILDWFHRHRHPRLTLICESEYVGGMKPARMRTLFRTRAAVTQAQLREARQAWEAFRAPDPSGMLATAKGGLRFLGAALRRQLEEYPWTTDQLSRLERQILNALEDGPKKWQEVFLAVQEEVSFLGDSVLRWHLARLAEEGLVERSRNLWTVKSRTRQRRVPRWLGGVLVDERCPWRWDPDAGAIAKQ